MDFRQGPESKGGAMVKDFAVSVILRALMMRRRGVRDYNGCRILSMMVKDGKLAALATRTTLEAAAIDPYSLSTLD